ncbi:MAG: hypothetical protein M3410_00705 [Acidobacteriota bacterium]|nr:hypothetical protein [Acidobacteriota bacterium]
MDIGPLNYFNYFTEIEDAFVRRRGKHLLVSSIDWALIETWKEMGVPLHVALRGVEKAFDSWEAKPRKRSVKTLLYCQEEVEAQYAEWLEAHVGAETGTDGEAEAAAGNRDEGLPFPRQTILEHLRRGRSALAQAFGERKRLPEDDFTDALTRAASLLEELERDFKESSTADAQKLEVSLTGLERMLSDAIRSVVPADQLEAVTKTVKEQLRPYRKHMDAAVYEQTFDNLLLKGLREQFAVPRLSLFYL